MTVAPRPSTLDTSPAGPGIAWVTVPTEAAAAGTAITGWPNGMNEKSAKMCKTSTQTKALSAGVRRSRATCAKVQGIGLLQFYKQSTEIGQPTDESGEQQQGRARFRRKATELRRSGVAQDDDLGRRLTFGQDARRH